MTKFTLLPWDTDFFGFKTGKIEVRKYDPEAIKEALNRAKDESFNLIYLIIPNETDNKEIFQNELTDQKVIFEKYLENQPATWPGIVAWEEKTVPPELYEIALESGKYSRFKTDEKLPAGCYEKLYRKWIEKSVSGEIADKVFVYIEDRRVLGLITVKIKPDHGEIGLLGIHPSAQGKGLGSKLIAAAENYATLQGKNKVEVATQKKNISACAFYEKNGYRIKSILNYYHIHLKLYI
jgi:dTDP-4-amino-4,6-dideoxy-D-galactose acyltransferase